MRALVSTCAFIVCVGMGSLVASSARAQSTFHPATNRRMAVVDRDPAAGMQARVYMVTYGGALVSKASAIAIDGWRYEDCCDYRSGVDAVGFAVGAVQRQRVVVATGGSVVIRTYDDDVFVGTHTLVAGPPDVVFNEHDVAVITYDPGGGAMLAVAAIADNGTVCVWEAPVSGLPTGSPTCSASKLAKTTDPDIDGDAAIGVPVFAFRTADDRIGLASLPAASWQFTEHDPPPETSAIQGSVALWQSQAVAEALELAVVAEGQVHTAYIDPGGPSFDWPGTPPMPMGASPSWRATTLAVARTTTDTTVFTKSSSEHLHLLQSDPSGEFVTWSSALRPPDEHWLGTGTAATIMGDVPAAYGTGGIQVIIGFGSTMQEFVAGQFRDHIRYANEQNVEILLGTNGATTEPANEASTSGGSVTAIATAIRRNGIVGPPGGQSVQWEVALADSLSGGATWNNEAPIPVVTDPPYGSADPISLTDPFSAMDSTGRFHHTVLEAALTVVPSDPDGQCQSVDDEIRRVIYRRGTAADIRFGSKVDGSTVFLVDTDNFDHPGLTVTEHEGGTRTHIAAWADPNGAESRVLYYTLDFVGDTLVAVPPPIDLTAGTPSIGDNPPVLFKDAAQTVFAVAGDFTSVVSTNICRLDPFAGCTEVGEVGGPGLTPGAGTRRIHFNPSAPPGPPSSDCLGGMHCFDTFQPFDVVADPIIPDRLYAVYQGGDPDSADPTAMSVYFTIHEAGASLMAWTTSIRVNTRSGSDIRNFVDPSVSVDTDGTVVVTYSALNDPELAVAEQYLAVMEPGATSFTEISIDSTWSPQDLPWHCKRQRYFLGEYHVGHQIGGRAYHTIHASHTGNTILRGLWSSQWSLYPY